MSIAFEQCPKCGAILAEAPQGLCPKCLLAAVSAPTEAGAYATEKSPPPPLETVRAAFPHLEILELFGQGGMGFVFKARQPKLDRFVALKILPHSLAADPAFAERFTREGRVLARLNHPNIVTIHDFGKANGFFYLLMEFVDGVNLRQAMKAGRFTPDQALAVVPKICEALQYAHNERVLHRDIKPENILLDTKGRVKIADFGIAKLVVEMRSEPRPTASAAPAGEADPETLLTDSGATLGTPNYMAPEQIARPSEVDHRADIYSLGVVFYEMLTGELPRGRFAPPSAKTPLDPRLDEVVLRSLQKERERRQQSAEEVKTQVESIAASTERIPSPPSALAWVRRTGILFLVVGGLAFLPAIFPFETDRYAWYTLSLLTFAGIALLTRNQAWRLFAIAFNGLAAVLCLINVVRFLWLAGIEKVVPDWWPGGYDWSEHAGFVVSAGLLQFLGSVAGIAALCRRDVRALFAHDPVRGPGSSLLDLRRWLWPAAALALMLLIVFGLPRFTSRWFARPIEAAHSPANVTTAANAKAAGSVTLASAGPPSVTSPGKTIVLTGATNEVRGDAKEIRVVSVKTDSTVLPGETFLSVIQHPDGRREKSTSSLSIHRRPNSVNTTCFFTWFFPESFSVDQMEEAAIQMRQSKTDRPITLRQGEPFPLFSVTNKFGGVLAGYLEFKRSEPKPETAERIKATVRLKSTVNMMAFYSATVPEGYSLQATAGGSDSESGEAFTWISQGLGTIQHHCSWHPRPLAFEWKNTQEATAQLERLRGKGPIEVFLGEPRLLFSITNQSGDIFQGFFELADAAKVLNK